MNKKNVYIHNGILFRASKIKQGSHSLYHMGFLAPAFCILHLMKLYMEGKNRNELLVVVH